jgi:hypothetical protein
MQQILRELLFCRNSQRSDPASRTLATTRPSSCWRTCRPPDLTLFSNLFSRCVTARPSTICSSLPLMPTVPQRLGFEPSQRLVAMKHPDGVFPHMPDRYLTAKHSALGVEVYAPYVDAIITEHCHQAHSVTQFQLHTQSQMFALALLRLSPWHTGRREATAANNTDARRQVREIVCRRRAGRAGGYPRRCSVR